LADLTGSLEFIDSHPNDCTKGKSWARIGIVLFLKPLILGALPRGIRIATS
jgi:hypothetical protein